MRSSKYDKFFDVSDSYIYTCPNGETEDCQSFSYQRLAQGTTVPLSRHLKEFHKAEWETVEKPKPRRSSSVPIQKQLKLDNIFGKLMTIANLI
jgi:hypothetical protein